MYKSIMAIVLLLLFVSPLLAQSIPQPKPGKIPETIFWLQAPKGWKLVAGIEDRCWYYTPKGIGKPEYAMPFMYGSDKNNGHRCNLAVYKIGDKKEPFRHDVSHYIEICSLFGGLSHCNLIKTKTNLKFGAEKVEAYEMKPDEQTKMGIIAYFITYKDSTWLLTYGGNAELFKTHKAAAMKALATFKLNSQLWFPSLGW